MNIVIIGTAYPLRGGIAHYVGLLYKYLSRRHDVTVVTFKRQYPKLLFPGKSQEETGDPGIPLESHLWIDSINPWTWLTTGLRVRRMKPDLVIYKFWLPFFAPAYGVIAAIAKWRRATRTLFICDNIIPHERRPGDRLFTRFAMRFVDLYLVQSRSVESDLLSLKPGAKYVLQPHPVYEIFGEELEREIARERLNETHPELDLSPGENIVLFFGYVRDYKGLDVLLDALPFLLEQREVRVLVVGEFYSDEKKYREQVERLGIGSHVYFHSSYVPNDEVSLFFSAADVVALPYHSATQSGIVQIAYNFNRPVVATDVGGLAEVVIHGRTGYIVAPHDPKAFAQALTRFFTEDRFVEFRKNVLEEKKKYTWDSMVEAIESLAADSHD
ncbi:MAG: glycosyltransferase [Chlorobi bacterium]|nr:glycosyltransferase [Chlorobiota bacterium]